MELSKEITDTYLNEDYITHLTWLVKQGHMEIDDLTEQEQEEVKHKL